MCVIAICPEGTSLNKEEFKKCFNSNDDGAGFAWSNGEKVMFHKGLMTADKAWKAYRKIYKFNHVAHFRLVSAGKECKELCHPFVISKDSPISLYGEADAVLFHNGTVYGWQSFITTMALIDNKYPEGEMSDSRAMAMIYARLGDNIIKNDTGKYVILDKDKVTTYGAFTEHEGRQFSNMLWNMSARAMTEVDNTRFYRGLSETSGKQSSLYDELWGGRNYYGY